MGKEYHGIKYEDIKNINDIRKGFKVQLRNGKNYLVMKYSMKDFTKVLINPLEHEIVELSEFNDDLTHKSNKDLDIIRVFGIASCISDYRCIEYLLAARSRPLLWISKDIKEELEKMGIKLFGGN